MTATDAQVRIRMRERQMPRQYRTRRDPFVEDWPTIEAMLEEAPSLEAKALYGWVCEQHPGKYQEGQLRTFQRRVAQWRALHQEQDAVLEQVTRGEFYKSNTGKSMPLGSVPDLFESYLERFPKAKTPFGRKLLALLG